MFFSEADHGYHGLEHGWNHRPGESDHGAPIIGGELGLCPDTVDDSLI